MATLIGFVALIVVAQAPDVDTLAAQAGVDPVDLQGAVNTTGLPPDVYLHMTGDLAPAPTIAGIWERLAECESRGRWAINTGNGYYGGLQEDMTFWRKYGGPAYASRPDLASKTAQVAVAQRGQQTQGWRAWPACSRQLGLR